MGCCDESDGIDRDRCNTTKAIAWTGFVLAFIALLLAITLSPYVNLPDVRLSSRVSPVSLVSRRRLTLLSAVHSTRCGFVSRPSSTTTR